MRLLGKANWWLPTWMSVVLHISDREPKSRTAAAV